MTFADGWVCQSCWKPNRPQDTRCYRCKTERGADKATIEARQQERKQDVTRRERVPDIVTLLPATVFAWYGRLTLLSGVLLLLLTPLILGNPEAPDGILVIWLGFAFGILAAGIAMRWASGAMRSSNPWAFALALVASVALVAMTLYAMNALPQGVGNPTWMRYILVGAFGLSAILAMVGLLFSLTGDQPEGPVDNA